MNDDNASPSRVGVVAAVVFGCATLAAIILMTWMVATDAARKDERAWQHNQIEELLQRTAVARTEYTWQHGAIVDQQSQIDQLKLDLAVLQKKEK